MVIILSKSHWYHSIRWKLFFVFLFISFVPILFFFNTIMGSIQDYYQEEKKKKLLATANIIAGNIAKANYLFDDTKRPLFDNDLEQRSRDGYRILVFNDKCYVVNDSNKTEIGNTLLIPEVLDALLRKNRMALRDDQRAIYASASIDKGNSESAGAVLLISSAADIDAEMANIEQTIFLFTILITVILAVLVFFMSQLLIDPLNNILKVVQKMSEGHLNQRIAVTGHDEYSQLGQAFNEMTSKLEQVEKTRELFVSNVSHELKTPLSSIKVLSESILLQDDAPVEMYKEFLQDISSEIDRMNYIVNDLLQLVKLDNREAGLNMRPTEINKMVEEILKRLSPLSAKKNIELIYEDVRRVTIDADEMKLSLAISNLVENGIKYTHESGKVTVIVDADHQNAFITVQDTGIGISEEEQGKVFTRFYRVDKTRDRETGGTGLGLSITHATILLHNGSIRLTSKENEGSTFLVRLPIHHIE